MRSFMIGVPPSIVEAARVDGAGLFRSFISIVVPISRNSLITAGLFTFLFAWGDFLFALTLTTTDDVRPVTLGIYNYLGAQVSNWNAVMATAVLSAIPAIVLLVVAQKYIAAGATGGAIKCPHPSDTKDSRHHDDSRPGLGGEPPRAGRAPRRRDLSRRHARHHRGRHRREPRRRPRSPPRPWTSPSTD